MDLVEFLSILASDYMPVNQVKHLVDKVMTKEKHVIEPSVFGMVVAWMEKAKGPQAFISSVDPVEVMDKLRTNDVKTVQDLVDAGVYDKKPDVSVKDLFADDLKTTKVPPVVGSAHPNSKSPTENEFSVLPWDETKDTTLDKYVDGVNISNDYVGYISLPPGNYELAPMNTGKIKKAPTKKNKKTTKRK